MSAISNGAYPWHTYEPDRIEDWRDRAACTQVDPELFFPEPGESPRNAKSICASCEVINECLTWAIETDEQFGVAGGLTRLERRRLVNPHVRSREHVRNPGEQSNRHPWTPEDDRILTEMYAAGHTDVAIAERLGRHSSVVGRRRRNRGMVALFKRGGGAA